MDEGGGVHAHGDAYAQARRYFDILAATLRELAADLSWVVRTRTFVSDLSRRREFGRAHRERFADHPRPPPCWRSGPSSTRSS